MVVGCGLRTAFERETLSTNGVAFVKTRKGRRRRKLTERTRERERERERVSVCARIRDHTNTYIHFERCLIHWFTVHSTESSNERGVHAVTTIDNRMHTLTHTHHHSWRTHLATFCINSNSVCVFPRLILLLLRAIYYFDLAALSRDGRRAGSRVFNRLLH